MLVEKKLMAKWLKKLDDNEPFCTYLKTYSECSRENAIKYYLTMKYSWYKDQEFYRKQFEKQRSKWIDLAHSHLEVILQKKLFDLQCLWRADEIKLNGIEICYDFIMVSENIMNYPFEELISSEEIVMYQQFLKTSTLDYSPHFYDWQEYERIKKSLKEESIGVMPEWYEFHNNLTGNSRLLSLPNSRGKKEMFYIRLNSDRINSKSKASQIEIIDTDEKPFLDFIAPEIHEYIVKTFDDNESQMNYFYYQEFRKGKENLLHYEEILSELFKAKELVEMLPNEDFKQALELTYTKYKNTKIAEHLPFAHEQYLFTKKMGLMQEEKDNLHNIRKRFADAILAGREINNEPRDFSF